MDEIKNVIKDLPPQDIAILKTLYNPEAARQELTDNGQRMIAILDGLSTEEQQEAVSVTPEELPQQEQGDINVEVSSEEIMPSDELDMQAPEEIKDEDKKKNSAGNLEDFLI